jgi:hypothetical protein
VRVELGLVPREIPDSVAVDELCCVSATEYLLNIPKVARYYAGHGAEVRVEVAAGAAPEDVRLYLLGSLFGALCHQNGYLPLHASAVATGGAVTAFLGDSGAGKSTMAAFLARRGHRIVSDDVCLVDFSESSGSGLRVIPVAGWLKLWRKSLDVLGEMPREENRLLSEDDKFRVYLEDDAPGPADAGQEEREPLVLKQVVFLERPTSVDVGKPAIEALGTAAAIAGLMRTTYLSYLPEATDGWARLFARCAAVLNHAGAYRLVAPLGFEHMDGVLALVERELLGRSGFPEEAFPGDPTGQVAV